MNRHQFLSLITTLLATATLVLCTLSASYAAELTQRDWMITIVDTLGWTYGLPDEPQDPDYINILSGNRELRFEAEDVYSRDTDNVSLMAFRNFGSFSGEGWLHGTREPTDVHLNFTLPVAGTYLIKAHLRQSGHQFKIGDKVATGDADQNFTVVTIGTFRLEPGSQEIIVSLPANGSIDYISLTAPNLAMITPDGGWQPEASLTWEAINTTLLQLFKLVDVFPLADEDITIEAEEHLQPGTRVVTIPHLGRPSAGKWLRAGPLDAEVRIPVTFSKSGFYDLKLRAMGNPLNIVIGGHHEINLTAKAYLDNYTISGLHFMAEKSNISVTLPPGGGIDQLSLTRRQVDAGLTTTLLGLNATASPSTRDLDTITTLLASFGIER